MNLDEPAKELVAKLREKGLKIVFAESCTGGLVAATLAAIPGVSDCLCGSAVTYRDEVKTQWLGVEAEMIQRNTAVCEQVAEEMACGVLQRTASADVAVSITGHLGPDAPPHLDGIAFVAYAWRVDSSAASTVQQIALITKERRARQVEAAMEMLIFAGNKVAGDARRRAVL